MRRPLVAALAVAFATLVVAVPRGQTPETGSVAGHVRLTTRIKDAAPPSTAYPTRAVGTHDNQAIPETRNVVMHVKDVAYRGPLRRRDMNRSGRRVGRVGSPVVAIE